MQDSLFTKIIKGETPCHKVYEDEMVFAFLDIFPVQPGHILVVPKKQTDQLDELDDDTYEYLMKVVKRLSLHVKKTLQVNRICLAVQGFDIPHAHVHLIPCNQGIDFFNQPDRSKEPDHKALAIMAAKLSIEGVI